MRRVNVALLANRVTGVKMVNRDHGALRDRKVLSVSMVVEVQREDQVLLDQRVKKEFVVILAISVPLFKGVLVRSVMREIVDLLAHKERRANVDLRVKRDLQDHQEKPDLKVNVVILDPRVNAARWVLMDLPVIPDLQVRRVFQVIVGPKENRDRKSVV